MLRQVRRLHSSALEYFLAVTEAGSFRAAARKLRIAPSAVNRHVLLLEEELGFELFERTPKQLKLSKAGELLRKHCIDTLRSFERTSEALNALRDLHTGVVRVGASESFAAEFVPYLCAKFSKEYPGVEIKVSVASSSRIIDLIDRDELDIGFAFGGDELRQGTIAARFALPIGAVVGGKHPLAKRKSVSIADCARHQMIFPTGELSFRRRLDEVSDLFSANRAAGIEASSPRMMIGIARLNHHVTFMTPLGLKADLDRRDLVFIPLEDDALEPDRCVLLTSFDAAERFAATRFAELAAVELRHSIRSSGGSELG